MKISFYNPRRLTFLAVVLVVCSALLGSRIEQAFSIDNEYQQLLKFKEVFTLVSQYYVDKVDLNKLNEAAIGGMLKELDPHSVYMPPVSVKQSDEDFRGSFEGIGVAFVLNHDSILVDQVIPGGPSEKVGLIAGDKIVLINGKTTKGFTEDSVKKNLRGPKNTKVIVAIARSGVPDLLNFEITRDVIPLNSVTAHFMIDDKTAYIALTHFIQTSHEEMVRALEDLRSQGMKSLILDLRGNPGGYLEQAVEIADEFIGGTKTIVYTKGRVSSFDEVDISHPGQEYEKLPLVVLVNNGSASASEIFSGAMQDLDRAPVVGITTFGKGLVQRQFSLGEDGSALRLTISRYYTPSGRSIQRPYDGSKYTKGIDNPDGDDEDNFAHAVDDKNPNDTTRPKFKTASGRTILGGGGITPDFIVKPDTVTKSTIEAFASSAFYDYTKDYVSENGASLHKKYSANSYLTDFSISDETLNSIIASAREKIAKAQEKQAEKTVVGREGDRTEKIVEKAHEQKVKLDDKELDADRTLMKDWLRAEIAYQLFGYDERAKILLKSDKQFQKAYALIGEAQKMATVFK
ncbi:MAG TPA: S41 family peptidase [Candidatus Kapabacteria bacterium]|nr:S41 family peptidase [Candidatus Kapabacteria bacterium]